MSIFLHVVPLVLGVAGATLSAVVLAIKNWMSRRSGDGNEVQVTYTSREGDERVAWFDGLDQRDIEGLLAELRQEVASSGGESESSNEESESLKGVSAELSDYPPEPEDRAEDGC